MHKVKVGHFTNHESQTGVTVFLFEQGATGAYWLCGAAPASHELAVLEPDNSVPKLYGLVFAGGSAFGLQSVYGAMSYLSERHIGHPTLQGVVPIVPAAAIYDLDQGMPQPPSAENAYQACVAAEENNAATGRIGAGTGTTVGKLIPGMHRMQGGLGYAKLTQDSGVSVMAYAVVNCVGDVRDASGNIVAGACTAEGSFANCEAYLLSGAAEHQLFTRSHSTLVAVMTNARLDKAELKRLAKMAIAGMPRAISPIFTRYDGDILFCISVGEKIASDLITGTMAAEVVRLAILSAIKGSQIIG